MEKLTIKAYQSYLERHYAGRVNDQGLFMKLVEEVGEVAEVLNQEAGRKAANGEHLSQRLTEELADVIHYTIAIAAVKGLDLAQVIMEKDARASLKYGHEKNLKDFLQEKGANHE